MLNVVASEAVTLQFDFIEGGEFVSPDVGSVTYTIRDNAGDPIAGQENQAINTVTDQTEVFVAIPTSVNSKATTLEYRTVEVDYLIGTRTGQLTQVYRIISRPKYRVAPQEVRDFYGVTPAELPDSAVDLYVAYLSLSDDITGAVVDAALVAGELSSIQMNSAIGLTAAIEVFQSLTLRVNQMEKSESAVYQRLQKIDWEGLRITALDRLTKLKVTLGSTTEGVYAPFILSTPTDPFTGI